MTKIHINVYRSHLLLQIFFAMRARYAIFTSMFIGPINFGSFSLLCTRFMANILINVHKSYLLLQLIFAMANILINIRKSHLIYYFFVIVGTHYSKYSHQCSQVPSTLTVFLCCAHTFWQIFASMLTGPIYFGNFFLLCTHPMANILINVQLHLLLQLFFAVGTP